jgi:drug/metabolite transporter (DMT)-like permease
VATRRLRRVPNVALVASQSAALALFVLPTAGGWVWPTPGQWLGMAMIGVGAVGGFLCMTRGIQLAPASVVTPFQYSGIVWAGALGYLVFGDVPGPATLIGAAVIIGAGIFIVLRGR